MTGHVLGIILAAGRGNRLRPLTDDIPKPLLEHNGTRFIDFSIEAMLAADVSQLVIVVGYLSEQIESHVHQRNLRVPTKFVEQKELLGSGDAFLQALKFIDRELPDFDVVCTVAADYLLPTTSIRSLKELRKLSRADASVLTVNGSPAEALRSSVVYQSNGFVTGIVEKPKPTEIPDVPLLAKLCYVFSSKTLEALPREVVTRSNAELSLPDLVSLLIDRYQATVTALLAPPFQDADEVLALPRR